MNFCAPKIFCTMYHSNFWCRCMLTCYFSIRLFLTTFLLKKEQLSHWSPHSLVYVFCIFFPYHHLTFYILIFLFISSSHPCHYKVTPWGQDSSSMLYLQKLNLCQTITGAPNFVESVSEHWVNCWNYLSTVFYICWDYFTIKREQTCFSSLKKKAIWLYHPQSWLYISWKATVCTSTHTKIIQLCFLVRNICSFFHMNESLIY